MFPVVTLACLQVGQSVRLPNRARFGRAMALVESRWTSERVREVLGPPDDVRRPTDPGQNGSLSWCYGTNGHLTFPTLGSVTFMDGFVVYAAGMASPDRIVTDVTGPYVTGYGTPPPSSVIPELELRRVLRAMYRPPNIFDDFEDPLRLIQVANLLIGLGQPKALAALEEYSRLLPLTVQEDWLYWVVRVAFTSKAPGGAFPVPHLGSMHPAPPRDPTVWPTYPLAVVDGVPFNFFGGASLGGSPPLPFRTYARLHESEWVLRHRPIVPPDDPFSAVEKLTNLPNWKLFRGESLGKPPLYTGEARAFSTIVHLVESAYRPRPAHDTSRQWETGVAQFRRYHREFLALHCRWDSNRQLYVRADGSTLH